MINGNLKTTVKTLCHYWLLNLTATILCGRDARDRAGIVNNLDIVIIQALQAKCY